MTNKQQKKLLCVDDLRHAEYYQMQDTFDNLYSKSRNGEIFQNLMPLILSRENILLAYRNIKSNGGSKTRGTDKVVIDGIGTNDGVLSINWEDVLAVFSAKVTGAEDGTQVASLDDTQVQQMRDIMWEMNAVSSSTRTESHEVEVTEVDEDGKETTRTETVTETILEISLTHKTAEEMAQQYNFNARQNEYLALMSEPENQNLWAELLGGFNSGGGQIMNPNTDWEGTGIFQWPLPQSYTITSWFGYREDPFTGEIAYHSGTDIGAPGGTPILTAADGTVTIANAIDTWGGGYGYYIKINHNDTFDTLYAHCSSICVTVGQEVKQGEVIGYVGTTGNSTGNHLHFEVWQNGERTDALGYFKAKE